MKLRIGDLVTYVDPFYPMNRGRGLVTALEGFRYVGKGKVEILERRQSIKSIICKSMITSIICKSMITSVTPREEVKEYWKYL